MCAFAIWAFNALKDFYRSSSSRGIQSAGTIDDSGANSVSTISFNENMSALFSLSPGMGTTQVPESPPRYEDIGMYPSSPSCRSNISDTQDALPPKYEDIIGT